MAPHTELVELLPRYAFLQAMIRGARVLEVGALEGTGGKSAVILHDRGAASVVSLGEGAAKAQGRHGGPGLTFRAGGLEALPPSSIDLALIHDAGMLLADGALEALQRVLGPGGQLVAALRAGGPSLSRNDTSGVPGAEAYGAILSRLLPFFPSIEVASQQALVGWVVAPAGVGDPALVVDDGFASAETPAFYLFLCGASSTGLRDQALVPLEVARNLGEKAPGGELVEQRTRAARLVEELRHTRELVSERQSWIEGLRHEIEELHRAAEEREAALKVANTRLVRLEREYDEASSSLARVREQLVGRARELEGARRALDSRTRDLRLAEEGQEALRKTIQNLGTGKLEAEEKARLAKAELEAASGHRATEDELESLRLQLAEALVANQLLSLQKEEKVSAEELEAATRQLSETRAALDALRLERETILEKQNRRFESLEVELAEAKAFNEVMGLERSRWLDDRKGLEQRNEGLEARVSELEGLLTSVEEAGGAVSVVAVQKEKERVEAELKALLTQGPGAVVPTFEEDARRIRDLEDRLDAASSRTRELEERMAAAERRSEMAESARAEAVAAARRWQLEAETARRDAAGVAAGMADRESLKSERDEALARAAEEAGRRAAIKNQLQATVERAAAAEHRIQALSREIEELRGGGKPLQGR